jgi:hypothetical protein
VAGFVNVNRAQGGHVSPGTVASTVEAIIGAVHIDSGHSEEVVRAVLVELGLVADFCSYLVTLLNSPFKL